MSSLLRTNCRAHQNESALRRSDRKKTKKIFKDDYLIPNPFKTKAKKASALSLPRAINSQLKKIEYFDENSLKNFHFGKGQFSLEMLREMQKAVLLQEDKLTDCLSIKLIGSKNIMEIQSCFFSNKQPKSHPPKENTPKISENSHSNRNQDDPEYLKDQTGMATAEELEYSQFAFHADQSHQASISGQDDESQYCLNQAPKFKKESSKLLSDNYESNELQMAHMLPSWHEEQINMESSSLDFHH